MTFELINLEFRCKKESKDFIYLPKKEAKKMKGKKRKKCGNRSARSKTACCKKGLWNERGINTQVVLL